MDLYAYKQIENLEYILSELHINIPRLRGLRLMEAEGRVSDEEVQSLIQYLEVYAITDLMESCWSKHEVSERVKQKYLECDRDGNPSAVRWENLHGKKRSMAKYHVKKMRNQVFKQYAAFNKYAGRSDVLYVHARIGSDLWDFEYGKQIEEHPAFLEKVDDCFDPTYCDIYLQRNLKGTKK